MKNTIIAGSLILTLIAGSAFAIGGGSGHGSMQGGQMDGSMDSGSMNHGSIDHESMHSGSMEHSSMNGRYMQTDQSGMPQDGRMDQKESTEGHQHQ